MTFRHRVLEVVRTIPRGSVMTYKQVAEAAGSPRAYRAVGTVVACNLDPAIPCHRVVKSDGTMGQYNRGQEEKRRLLILEGVSV